MHNAAYMSDLLKGRLHLRKAAANAANNTLIRTTINIFFTWELELRVYYHASPISPLYICPYLLQKPFHSNQCQKLISLVYILIGCRKQIL